MLPFTTQESIAKRNINLGGATSQSSHTAILDRARLLRNARRDERKKEDAALKIQKWLISQRETQSLRTDLRAQFDLGPHDYSSFEVGETVSFLLDTKIDGTSYLYSQDMRYVTWTRLLLLSGADEGRLSCWSREMLDNGYDNLMGPFRGNHKESWLVLIRQIAFLLLQSASRDPWYVLALGTGASCQYSFFGWFHILISALRHQQCIYKLFQLSYPLLPGQEFPRRGQLW